MAHRIRLLVVSLVAAAGMALAGGAAPALAASGGPIVTTVNFHLVQSFERTNMCTGNPMQISETSNIVQHIDFHPDTGISHVTFTEEDNITAVDTVTGVTYAGHGVNHGDTHTNLQNSSFSFTVLLALRGSDGSRAYFHENSVFVVNPNGVNTVYVDSVRLSC